MKLIFLCQKNACASQMAEAFAQARPHDGVEITSAGLELGTLHPTAIKVMAEVGIDLSRAEPRKLEDMAERDFDVVITLCRDIADQVPVLPGFPLNVHWNLNSPSEVTGSEEIVLSAFRQARDEIKRLVDDFFDKGYRTALQFARDCEGMLLDNISDGILAHDMSRRIFHFNKAAEVITGYSRDEIIGRDCHDIFPGRFCGGKCLFCEDPVPTGPGTVKREIDINTKNGERRTVDTALRMMTDVDGRDRGVLLSLHDVTRERALARRVGEINQFSGIIGHDEKMLEIYDLIRDLADTDVPVLIQGESGTGKELVAAAIHNEGHRGNRLFVPINCGALPESLLESELFGHVKGAFTGAVRDKKGRFELADGGTIFLDEIGDISPTMQVKLMRVLQEGTFERVGGETTVTVDVRVISATNKDLQEEIADGRFRDDLYYRLSVVPLWLPPLRDRRTDVPMIAEHILKLALKARSRGEIRISEDAMDMLLSYAWPGNVRELQNWLQFALVKCKSDTILPEHFPPPRAGAPGLGNGKRKRKLNLGSVREAIRATDGNKLEAAKRLGVSRATLYRFLEDVDL
ncbi:MAG: sigma 54-interacting transcriptional regulator [Verrucomicrobia bacterium]|jgi:sigma-54 dependent transcriptional regulator, acetoin dehydrogenase operon transcriptional activator AcoR|nr:sigma 54-interacting transcriptional regulator [Verrucomicrobiota bacterium]MBT7067325.1 sigma 54-interacting transcriptional regulator [Verrucomicrobiota bacterium]MBT7699510.1 sigma 54-interacting transcriptional regulator [Verrucomicrobiota bacterium]